MIRSILQLLCMDITDETYQSLFLTECENIAWVIKMLRTRSKKCS